MNTAQLERLHEQIAKLRRKTIMSVTELSTTGYLRAVSPLVVIGKPSRVQVLFALSVCQPSQSSRFLCVLRETTDTIAVWQVGELNAVVAGYRGLCQCSKGVL